VIIIDQGRYKINPSVNIWCDLSAFEQSSRFVYESKRDPKVIAVLEKTLEIYKGPFLNEVYSEWAEEKRKNLEETYLKNLTLLARLYQESGMHPQAIETLERYIATEPYQDDAYYQLIEQHLLLDDEVSASRVYRKYCDTLASDLGSEPSQRMIALRRRFSTI
jgi:two-component SAPR family response regulator